MDTRRLAALADPSPYPQELISITARCREMRRMYWHEFFNYGKSDLVYPVDSIEFEVYNDYIPF